MNKLNSFLVSLLAVIAVVLIAPSAVSKYKSFTYKPNTVQVASLAPASATSPLLATQNQAAAPTKTLEVIELTSENTAVLATAFDDQSVSLLMVQLQALADKAPKGSTVYLVLNTPGGSVDAGLRLISFIKGLNVRVKTLTLFSASMGFQTVQNLDERLILDTGTLMSHRAKFGVSGQGPGELFSRLKWIMSMVDRLDAIAARRMQLPFATYRELVREEYWTNGADAVRDNAADREVLAHCGKGMNGIVHIDVATMFGSYDVELSKCPLVPGYLSASPKGGGPGNEAALQYVRTMMGNRTQFVNEYIVTNQWMKFQK